MTSEQVHEITGRELDAAVAQYVFGWRVEEVLCGSNRYQCLIPPGEIPKWPFGMESLPTPRGCEFCWYALNHLPRYSTDLNAAWCALQKVCGFKHRSFKIDSHDSTGAEPCMVWCKIKNGNHEVLSEGMGGLNLEELEDVRNDNDMAAAICRAAILVAVK